MDHILNSSENRKTGALKAKETKARKNNRSLEKRPYPILSGFALSRKRWSTIIPKEWKLLAASSERMHRVTTVVSGRTVKCNVILAAFEIFCLDLKRCCWSVLLCGYFTFPICGNTMLRYEPQILTTLFCTLKSDFVDVKSFEFYWTFLINALPFHWQRALRRSWLRKSAFPVRERF